MLHKVITTFQATGDGVLNTGVAVDREWRIAPSISLPVWPALVTLLWFSYRLQLAS